MTINQRLSDGWNAQQGACNPSGLIISAMRAIVDCIEEQLEACNDIGISLVVHQLHSLMAYPSYDDMRAQCERLNQAGKNALPNGQLLQLTNDALDRCRTIRSDRDFRGTQSLCNDSDLQGFVLGLYVGTMAETYDHGLNAYSEAYHAARIGAEARQKEVTP